MAPTVSTPVLDVVDYTKAYDRLVAVQRLSFQIGGGQVVGLVGPNGAGKTTTMRAIAGIIPPTSGSLRVCGHDVVAEPVAAKRRLAYVPDDPKLFDTLTVEEHLQFTGSVYDVRDWRRRGDQLLERFELAPKRRALARELSRGMRQKLAICCAYLHEPDVIMFDEPMTGLDPLGIRTLKQSIHEHAARGAGVLISSHLLALVEDLTTHLLILDRGVRIFTGSLADARANFAGGGASLEEVFFRATSGGSVPVVPGGPPAGSMPVQSASQPAAPGGSVPVQSAELTSATAVSTAPMPVHEPNHEPSGPTADRPAMPVQHRAHDTPTGHSSAADVGTRESQAPRSARTNEANALPDEPRESP